MRRQRNIWSFSLREMFFAFTAICVVVGWFVSNRPFVFSKFYTDFDVNQSLVEISDSYDMKFYTPSTIGSSSGTTQDLNILIETPGEQFRHEIMAKLLSAVESSLLEEGCTIYGRSGGVDSNSTRFRLLYVCGNTHGFFYANSFPEKDNKWWLVIVRTER